MIDTAAIVANHHAHTYHTSGALKLQQPRLEERIEFWGSMVSGRHFSDFSMQRSTSSNRTAFAFENAKYRLSWKPLRRCLAIFYCNDVDGGVYFVLTPLPQTTASIMFSLFLQNLTALEPVYLFFDSMMLLASYHPPNHLVLFD